MMSEVSKILKLWFEEFKGIPKGVLIERPFERLVVTTIEAASDKVKSLQLPITEIVTNRKFIKHVVESRMEEFKKGKHLPEEINKHFNYLAENIQEVLRSPTKIADNSHKRAKSLRFARRDQINERIIGIVIEANPREENENITTIHFMSLAEYDSLESIR